MPVRVVRVSARNPFVAAALLVLVLAAVAALLVVGLTAAAGVAAVAAAALLARRVVGRALPRRPPPPALDPGREVGPAAQFDAGRADAPRRSPATLPPGLPPAAD
jgi:hypothetical protein